MTKLAYWRCWWWLWWQRWWWLGRWLWWWWRRWWWRCPAERMLAGFGIARIHALSSFNLSLQRWRSVWHWLLSVSVRNTIGIHVGNMLRIGKNVLQDVYRIFLWIWTKYIWGYAGNMFVDTWKKYFCLNLKSCILNHLFCCKERLLTAKLHPLWLYF